MKKINKFEKIQRSNVPAKGWSAFGGNCQKFGNGFSLIEVLVALLVLSMGFTAVFALMANNIKSSENAKNQIIASQLAQEGIELVRNMKDNKELDTADTTYTHCNYTQENSDGTIRLCNRLRIDETSLFDNNANKRLYLNSSFYTHGSSVTPTKFYRRIDLSITGDINNSPSSTREITVTAYVTWNGSGFIANIDNNGLAAGNCNIANKCVSAVSVLPDYLSN